VFACPQAGAALGTICQLPVVYCLLPIANCLLPIDKRGNPFQESSFVLFIIATLLNYLVD
jgi:hypothetical protein